MKKCPFCAEEIQDAAIVCSHCRRDLEPAAPESVASETAALATKPTPARTGSGRQGLILLGSGFGAYAIAYVASFASEGVALLLSFAGFALVWLGMARAITAGPVVRFAGGLFVAVMSFAAIGNAVMRDTGAGTSSAPPAAARVAARVPVTGPAVGTPRPAVGSGDGAHAAAIRKYLKENFGYPGMETSWYPRIAGVTVSGRKVVVSTTMSVLEREGALGICGAVSGFVFSNERRGLGMDYIQVLGASEGLIVSRRGLGDRCEAR